MSQSNIPNITPVISVTRDDALNLLLSSIALEELGLSHIINAEGEKIQFALGTLPGVTSPPASISDLLLINESVRGTINDLTKKEFLLQSKLESVLEAPSLAGPAGPTGPTGPAPVASFAYLYSTEFQSIASAPAPGEQGGVVSFNNTLIQGTAINFAAPSTIQILEDGFYRINWEVSISGGTSAFALFSGTGALIPGSNYGSVQTNATFTGQVITALTAGETLTLNRITQFTLVSLTNSIGSAPVVSASVIIEKLT